MNFRPLLLASLFGVTALSFGQAMSPELFSGLVWRNIGPFRGGRVAAVSGAIGQPGTFYMGLPLGGVWKTTSAGSTWVPIFDDIKAASSVGAIEVAPSNPNVIYVGMGDMITGGGINEGNGVYKSTDAGMTWQHLGLEASKQIPSILVDPHNPEIVFVCAQGDVHQKSEDRGVFRSTDGGKTWARTLFVDDQTGAQKITWAPDHPEVMLATTVRHYNAPGQTGRPGGGGAPAGPAAGGTPAPGTAPTGTLLFKSTDEGKTWTQVTGGGLPTLSGRTSVAIAQGTQSKRMFLVGNFGLYRSDDGGVNWKQMDPSDRRVANGQGGYNCGVYVNPANPDIVYVVNTCSYVSHDGGETFTGFKGAPGGDDPQQFWFDPTDGNRIFLGSDQGATISQDGGLTWSSWYNQPTGQVYHISVDNQFPYWVYATQQDSGSIGTASRGNYGAITPLDWHPHPGYEFGSIVADPLDPRITYAGGAGSGIVKVTNPTGQWIDVSPSVEPGTGLRHVGNQPLMFNPTNPRELMAGFQFLMSTTDGGKTWKKISPDLGYPKGQEPPKPGTTPPPAGRPTTGNLENEVDDEFDPDDPYGDPDRMPEYQFAAGGGGAIESFSPSPIDKNVIWVGTNNALIKVTRDHGKTWEDVSIPNLPARADISAIDASHFDTGTAYAAVDTHGLTDFKPSFFKTHDFGQTWTKIVSGLPTDLPSGSFSRVIREDTVRPGLIFAGTESFVYVSFDDGDHWQSLALNLPNTSYRDMVIKGKDLVVGTYGRSFWILDDLSPLRQVQASMVERPAVLFQPGDTYRLRRNVNQDTPFPPEVPHALNPPVGGLIYYYLQEDANGPVRIEISDSKGHVLRHLSSEAMTALSEPAPPIPDYWIGMPKPLPADGGMHRINWDLRLDNPPTSSHSFEINANPGETPPGPLGPIVPPGTYTVKLIVGGKEYVQKLNVLNDPRSEVSSAALRKRWDLEYELYTSALQAWDAYQQVTSMRGLLADVLKANQAEDLTKAANDLDAKLTAIGGAGGGRGRFGGGGGGGGFGAPGAAAPLPTFVGTHGNLLRRFGLFDNSDMPATTAMLAACHAALKDFTNVSKRWAEFNATELTAYNLIAEKYHVQPIPKVSTPVPSRH